MTERKIYLFSISMQVIPVYKHFFYDIYDKKYVCINSYYSQFENYYMKYNYLDGYQGHMYPAYGFSVTEPVEHVLGRSFYELRLEDLLEICNNYLLNKIIDTLC